MMIAGLCHLSGHRLAPEYYGQAVWCGLRDGARAVRCFAYARSARGRCGATSGRNEPRQASVQHRVAQWLGSAALWLLPLVPWRPACAQVAVPRGSVATDVSRNVARNTGAAAALFGQVLDTIQLHYNGPIDDRALTNAALKAMVASLDGHSSYMTPDEYRQFDTSAKGQFAGIGVVIERLDQAGTARLRVIAPTDGGPSARAGVGAGWEIVSVDGVAVRGFSLQQATDLLRGADASKTSVTFLNTQGQERTLELTREIIHLHSLYARRIAEFGYIHLTGFTQAGDREFADAVAALRQAGPLAGLIIDLRNNTGGFIDTANAIAGHFLAPGAAIVRVGNDAKSVTPITAPTGDRLSLQTLPLVVLVNGGSASASEILAAALQDNHRAPVVGLVTFGKGVVQTIYPLDSGKSGAVSVTTMRYYTPSGRSIQRVGIVPDLLVARTAGEAIVAVSSAPTFSEADVARAPLNEMKLVRFHPTEVEGPPQSVGSGEVGTDPILFRQPLPTDGDILADFQIQRALDVLKTGSVASARRLHPATLYRSDPIKPSAMVKDPQR